MVMPGRSYIAQTAHRYGFNGKEKDNETYGEGNEYDYGFRIYNPRIGRFLSIDPLQKKFAYLTPYQFSNNTPNQAIDIDGLEAIHFMLLKDKDGTTYLKFTGVQERY